MFDPPKPGETIDRCIESGKLLLKMNVAEWLKIS
jgi:hypothetical protein